MVSRTELSPNLAQDYSTCPDPAMGDVHNDLSSVSDTNFVDQPTQELELGPGGVDGHDIDWLNFSWESSLRQRDLAPSAAVSLPARQPAIVQTEFPRTPGSSSASPSITLRRLSTPAAEQGARLVLHIIRAFPEMMLRRPTFPPFIHQYWHTPTLPEKLATCMSISQLFVSRTLENRPFIWRSIDGEEQRFRNEVSIRLFYELVPSNDPCDVARNVFPT
jgi:hypothetical protein